MATLAVVSACGSSTPGVAVKQADQATTEPVATTSAPATTVIVTTIPVTTVSVTAAPTTIPVTTAPATSTTATATTVPQPPANIPGGWQPAAQPFNENLFPPLDESNWTGVPSPPLPTDPGQRLVDGIYEADFASPWNATNPATVDIVVHRIVPCSTLPANSCIDDGTPFTPDVLGVDNAVAYPIIVPLDSSVGVGLTGYECNSIDKTGNGADLAALFSAFDAAYKTAIQPQVTAGVANQDIITTLTAAPAAGFSGSDVTCGTDNAYALVFHAGDAPPILMQSVSDISTSTDNTPLTPTTAVRLDTIQVVKGVMTMYLYAGFYS